MGQYDQTTTNGMFDMYMNAVLIPWHTSILLKVIKPI